MSFSYDNTDLGTDTASGRLNATRLLLGDTDSNDPQVQDAEVNFALSQTNNSIYSAAAWLARAIAGKYARQVNIDLDGQLSADYSDLAEQYNRLADQLEYQATKIGAGVGIKAGGITKTDIEIAREQTNRVKPSFRRDRFWNPPSYDGMDFGYEDY